ncbi:MAG: hypothetical protein AAF928_20225 [Myxococcota bacterium]
MANEKNLTGDELAALANDVRKELDFRDQDRVYALAVKVGYLAAHADGEVEATEKAAIVEAVDVLSKGTTIELEVDALIAEADTGPGAAASLGNALKDLGQAEAGFLVGAYVAAASAGIDDAEREVLFSVAAAAGLSDATRDRLLGLVSGG